MNARDTGGLDADGTLYDASFECDDCGTVYTWPVTPGLAPNDDPLQVDMLALIREHEDGGCSAGALLGLEERLRKLPRGFYFGAADRQGDTEAIKPQFLTFEKSRRQRLVSDAIQDAETLIGTFRQARNFDRLGNTPDLLPQLADLLEDVVKRTNNFIDDVRSSADRYRRVSDATSAADVRPFKLAAAVEPTPQAPAAAASNVEKTPATPKPGPGLARVVEDEVATLSDFEAAFDRAAAKFKADRR